MSEYSDSQQASFGFETLLALHKITADQSLTLADKLNKVLALGCETFGLPIGLISKIEGQRYTIDYVRTPGGEIQPGQEFSLGETYCCHALDADGPLAFDHAGNSYIATHPCYINFALESYIGTPLIVNGKRYGTLNFSSPEVHAQPFNAGELELIRLIAQGVGNELARDQAFKALQSQRQTLESISSLARIGSWSVDLKTQEVHWSSVTKDIHDVPDDFEPELDTAINFYKEGYSRDRITEVVERGMQSGQPWSEELQIVTASGKEKWVAAIGRAEFEHDECVALVGTFQDIDERVRSNLMLRKAKDAAEAAATAKSEFLANMSHEIRTPMNGVMGILDILSRSSLEATQKAQVNIAKSSADALLSLLNDILDFSKIEAGKLSLENIEFSLAELFDETYHFMKTMAQEKQLGFHLCVDGLNQDLVQGDSGRLRQVLINLIGNAIKFTKEGEVTIKAYTQVEADGIRLFVEVADTGIGIDSQNLDHLFDAFTQNDTSTTRRFGGTGLGLAIVEQLTQLMSGSVRVSSQIGEGSCFQFNVLLNAAESSQGALPDNPPGTLQSNPQNEFSHEASQTTQSLRILLAEDNKVNQLVAEQLLAMKGYQCDIADNGEKALQTLLNAPQERPYTLVLMDCQMPVMDGYEATRKIRAGEAGDRYLSIPIVALTANAMQGDREKCLEAGMTDYLTKPINGDELYQLVAAF